MQGSSFRPKMNRDESDEESNRDPARAPHGMKLLAIAAAILFMVMGTRSALKDLTEWRRLSSLESYLTAPGIWIKVDVRQDTARSSGQFHPDILYDYYPEGKSIWGWRLSYEEKPKNKKEWEDRLKPYRVGDSVRVYWNPADPKDAVIEKKHDGYWRVGLNMAVGILFAIAGLTVGIVALSLRK